MYINYFESSSEARLNQILQTLKNIHGVSLSFDLNTSNVDNIISENISKYETLKNKIIHESAFNTYQQNPEYIKCMLLLEAFKLMLTEIAPKRRRKNKMTESTVDESMNIKPTISTQLSDIASKIPQTSDDATAFSNLLSSLSDKIAYNEKLDVQEEELWAWIKSLPRPVNVPNMITAGVQKFGPTLVKNREDAIKSMPKVDLDETEPTDAPVETTSLSRFKRKHVGGLYNYDHFEDADGNWIQVSADRREFIFKNNKTNEMSKFNSLDELKAHVLSVFSNQPLLENIDPAIASTLGQAHHYEYQASMARSELYRNSKYAMSMIKQIDPNGEVEPWIASSLAKAAGNLDKIYHYLDYYKKFEPEKLPEDVDSTEELGKTSGSATRQSLLMIIEYSTKLFNMIRPNDKLEGWVAMKLTTSSESISSCKHYMDYVQFETNALDGHFSESKRKYKMTESADPIAKKAGIMIGPKGVDKRDLGADELALLKRVASGNYSGADRAKASKLITTFYKPNPKLPESIAETSYERDLDETKPVIVDYLEGMKSTQKKKKFKNFAAYQKWLDAQDGNVSVQRVFNESMNMINEQEDLAKASTILAAKDMSNQIQDIAEDVAKMAVEDLMPLADIMRGQFGQEAAAGFNHTVKAALEELLDLTTKTKEIMDSAIDTLNTGGVPAEATDIENQEIAQDPEMEQPATDDDLAKDLNALDADAGLDSGEPLGRAKKDEIAESAPPGKKAEDFIKKNKESFKERYGKKWEEVLYATAWKKFGDKNESYDAKETAINESKQKIMALETSLAKHRIAFKKLLAEGKVSDPLNVGYGLEGDEILYKLSEEHKKIASIKKEMVSIIQEGVNSLIKSINKTNKVAMLESIKDKTPFGVSYKTSTGKNKKKMFETSEERGYWLDLNSTSISNVNLIEPATFDSMINNVKKG